MKCMRPGQQCESWPCWRKHWCPTVGRSAGWIMSWIWYSRVAISAPSCQNCRVRLNGMDGRTDGRTDGGTDGWLEKGREREREQWVLNSAMWLLLWPKYQISLSEGYFTVMDLLILRWPIDSLPPEWGENEPSADQQFICCTAAACGSVHLYRKSSEGNGGV